MTGAFLLDWAALALSLTNTILLFWLGTMVLLNLERRTLGGWMAAIGLLFGGIFFVSHTAILGYGIQTVSPGTTLWWGVGLLVVMVLPVLWYVMMLWYGGYWTMVADDGTNSLVKRHRPWAWVMLLFLLGLLVIAWLVQSQPVTGGYPTRGLTESISVSGVPVVLVLYPMFLVMCMGLSLDVVRKPGPSSRLMGELARDQAKPWLMGASLALLLVSLSVLGVFGWAYQTLEGYRINSADLVTIGRFDVLIEALITVAVILVGQAVVAYEIFTGQSLPRKGFLRQWQYAVLLALGFGFVIGFVFSTNLRPIYGILLSTLMMTLFAALLSWRMVTERQRTIRSLRPFVSSRLQYDQILQPEGVTGVQEVDEPFQALCREVLGASRARLMVLGPLVSLSERNLEHPPSRKAADNEPVMVWEDGFEREFVPEESMVALEGGGGNGFDWAVPLWNQRGLMGALLLGPKLEGGIYSREEIEIAQSSGERMVDAMVSGEITQRLLRLQRQRMTESQVLDQRTRRTLHDEVLQQLHAAILALDASRSRSGGRVDEAIRMITEVHGDVSGLLRNLPGASVPDLKSHGLLGALEELVRVEVEAGFDSVVWDVTVGGKARAAKLSELETEVVYYATREALRNAARYGRASDREGEFILTIRLIGGGDLRLEIEDNGVGIELQAAPQGGGQGLALHSTMMAVIGGELRVESEPGRYTRVILALG